jgi:hypothetical protein
MDDALKRIGEMLGGGLALALVVLVLLYIVRGAVATAVTQAGSREMERLRGEIQGDLQSKRDAAAQALEQFKAGLTLEAEVRRQTAGKKVQALLKVSDETIALMRVFYGTKGEAHAKRCYDAGIAWSHATVEVEVLLGPPALAELMAFRGAVTEVTAAFNTLELGATPVPEAAIARLDAEGRLEGARLRLFDMLRRELQIGAEEKPAVAEKGAR